MRRSVPKWLSLIAVFSFLMTGLTGCGRGPDLKTGAAGENSLVIWGMGVEGERLKEVVKLFEEENPGVKITVQSIPWGMAHEKLITAVAGELTPDLCQMGTTWIPEFTTIDALEPLDDLIAGSQALSKEDFFAGSWETGNIDGKQFGIPWYVDTRVLFYRTDVLKEAGFSEAPHNWDELKSVAQTLFKKNDQGGVERYGVSLPAIDWMTLCMFFWSNGGDILTPDHQKVIINSPENREALDFYASFFSEGLTPLAGKAGVELYNSFKTGLLPMFIGGSWMMEDLRLHVPDIEGRWNVAVLPLKRSATSFVGGSDWVIFQRSKKKELAWTFIEFMSRPEVQVNWYQLTTDVPTRVQAWEDPFFKDKPMLKVFGQQLSDVKTPPRIQRWEEMTVNINQQMERVVFGKTTSEQALATLETELSKILFQKRR